jgi:3-deoxy-D-manno-octulosonic-acid transferase
VLRKVSLWMAQSDEDARRLVAMGADPATVKSTGNLKFDVRAPKQSRVAELIKEVAAGRPIVVAGSTLDGKPQDEELILINAWNGALRNDLRVLLVLAPRHPDRFAGVQTLAAASGRSVTATRVLAGQESIGDAEIILLNTIGDLAAVYGVADVAFVGGSLVDRGGHNPLEPAQFGVPVVMGPNFQNFRNVVQSMLSADGIRVVDDNEGLETVLKELLTSHPWARAIGERGRQVFEQQQGATVRSVAELLAIIGNHEREGRND